MVDENTVRSGNLFDFATSELSQDAFVCWLCSRWDDPDDTVCAASQNLLRAMLGSHDPKKPVQVLQVARQRCHVDVALLTEHADVRRIVIVEDKTGSVEHDDQLRRYSKRTDDLFPANSMMTCASSTTRPGRSSNTRVSPTSAIPSSDWRTSSR